MLKGIRVFWPTARRYLTYGAMVGLLTASVTWNLLLGLQVWAISSVVFYLMFCVVDHALGTFEVTMENATSAARVEMRQRSIDAGRSGKPAAVFRGPEMIGTDGN